MLPGFTADVDAEALQEQADLLHEYGIIDKQIDMSQHVL